MVPGYGVIQMKTRRIGKDAKTGKIIPIKEAERRKATAYVQTVKVSSKRRKR